MFPTARLDASEWLLGKGLLNKPTLGIKNALEEGLPITAEISITRPTYEYLEETVAVLHRLGETGFVTSRTAES